MEFHNSIKKIGKALLYTETHVTFSIVRLNAGKYWHGYDVSYWYVFVCTWWYTLHRGYAFSSYIFTLFVRR